MGIALVHRLDAECDRIRRGARLTVLHYDADHDRIAEITGRRTRWVVPSGSVP